MIGGVLIAHFRLAHVGTSLGGVLLAHLCLAHLCTCLGGVLLARHAGTKKLVIVGDGAVVVGRWWWRILERLLPQ